MTLSNAFREAIAHLQQLSELRFIIPSPTLLSDNQNALEIAENPTNFQKAKHIDIRYHFIRHALESNQISANYISTSENLVNILMKALELVKYGKYILRMGLHKI